MTVDCTGRTILIVEDNQEIRESLCDALVDEGYDVVTACNGCEGLERLRKMETPCLILVDLLMPVMNGSEFLAALRATDVLATLPAVIVSAWPDEAQKLRDRSDGFIKKPVSLTSLLEVAARFCSPRRGEREPRREPS
jgi:CheY-like chemotaxis protein